MNPTRRSTVDIALDWIRLGQLEPHPHNPRRALGDVGELAASIRAHGVLEPVVVAPGSAEGVYRLIAGHRRVKAAGQAGLDVVPALIRVDLDGDSVQLQAMLVENLHRSDLSPMEEADAYSQLRLEFDLKPAAIAKAIGRSKATVDQRIALKKLPEQLQDKVHMHQVSLAEAAALVEFAGDSVVLENLSAYAGTAQFSGWAAHYRKQKVRSAEHAKRVKAARTEGVRVVPASEAPAGWTWGAGDGVKALAGLAFTAEAIEAHATSCEHHVLVDDGSELVPACAQPQAHRPVEEWEDPARPAPVEDEEARLASAADAEARAAEVAALREGLEVADSCRRTFLTELVRGRKPAATVQAEMLAEVLRAFLLGEMETDPVALAELLGVQLPEAGEDEDDVNLALRTLTQHIDERWTNTQLVQAIYAAALLVDMPHQARSLTEEWGWSNGGGSIAHGYLEHLGHLGYEPTDTELALLAKYDPARAAGAPETASA
jgi:ParB family chromosome partitioning protein